MMTKKLLVALVLLAVAGMVNADIKAGADLSHVVLGINNNNDGAPATYPSAIYPEVIQPGMVGTFGANTSFNNGSQDQPLGSMWPNHQGITWTGGPVISGAYTIEMVINPDFTHAPGYGTFGLNWLSTLASCMTFGDSTVGDMHLWVDQNTGKISFQPQGNLWENAYNYGNIESSVALVEGDSYEAGPWYHLAIVVDQAAGYTKMYLGTQPGIFELVGTGIVPAEALDPETDDAPQLAIDLNRMGIGDAFWPVTQWNFQGQIDSYAFQNIAATTDQFVLEVPEPTTITLLAAGLGMIIRRKRS